MDIVFPDWLESAIEAQNADALRPRLTKHWISLRQDVFPALESLDSIEKRQVMECVLWAGVHWQSDDTNNQRMAFSRADALVKRAVDLANDLVNCLNDIRALSNDNHKAVMPLIPNLWELIEGISTSRPNYAGWLNVMKSHGDFDKFINTAFQGRPGPNIIDVISSLSMSLINDDVYSTQIGKALASRKSTADQLRILLTQLRQNLAYPLRTRFALPDKAIAALATALFDRDPPITADAVKTRRHQLASEDR